MKIMFHVFRVLPPDFSWNFSKSQGLYIGRKLYTKTRTSLCSVLRSFVSQSLYRYRGWSSEFFQVLKPTWGRAWNFSKSQDLSLYTTTRSCEYQSLYWGWKSEFFQVPGPLHGEKGRTSDSRSHIFHRIFHIFLYISCIFPHISS